MSFGMIASVLMAIVGVAALTVFITSGNTANIISAFGDAFSSSLKASMGKP